MSRTRKGNRLTPDEIDQVVQQKLDRVPVRTIADTLGCAVNTVQSHWHKWLEDQAEERAEVLVRHQSTIVARLDSVATMARLGALNANETGDHAGEARFLAEERQALRDIGRVTGLDSITIAAQVDRPLATATDEEAQQMLDKLPDETLAALGLQRLD